MEKGIRYRRMWMLSNLPWHFNGCPFATYTLKGSVGTTGRCGKVAILSLMKLYVESLSMSTTT